MFSATLNTDILALRCVNAHICVGVGNFLKVYEIKSRELVAKYRVFEHDRIHGIVKGPDNQLFIYGGKNLSICELEFTDTIKINSTSVRRFDDWIIAVGWTNNRTTQFLSLLFAHNNLRFYDTNDETVRTVWCKERCILYGGSVLTKNNGETIIFSGTVFQEILIWRAKYGDSLDDIPILHRLRGHKGVIFSVFYDPKLGIISSTSDDRTIRLWRVKNKCVDETDEILWDDCDISLRSTMYGHTARVWRSYVRDEKIFTIGEDSLMCVWSVDGKLLDKIEAHGGAEIWSIDVCDNNEFIFTGGADGAVNFWHYELEKHPPGILIYASEEGQIPKLVSYTADGNIFIFMDGGRLMIFDRCTKMTKASVTLPRYSNYCVAQISPDKRKIALGSKDGWMDIYDEIHNNGVWELRNIATKKVMETKIFSMHWLSNETILFNGAEGHLKLHKKIMDVDGEVSSLILPASRERWTTAAILHENHLICGDRAGSVFIYDLTRCEPGPVKVFSKIHGRLGVQSFAKWANNIVSTGRDGTLRFYGTKCDSTEFQYLHMRKMPMDWVAKILHINGDLYILGFKEVELIAYSMNLRRIVRRFDCGGGHRSWDCTAIDEKMNFTYIREKKVYEMECSLGNNNLPIISAYHSKEIYCVEVIGEWSNHNIIVSASEDCTLCVACVVSTESKIERYRIDTLGIYDGHISSVKSLAVLKLNENDEISRNLVISGGGRGQLKIWEIAVKIDGKNLSSDDVTCSELLSYMLRGTDKDRKKKWQNAEPGFFVDPETRFMDICAFSHPKDSNLVVIFVACSDGYLRTFIYDVTKNILNISDIVIDCKRCTLRISTIEYDKEIILMAMTTDGFLSFWLMNDSIEIDEEKKKISKKLNDPFAKIKIHQSGINSFDSRKIDDSRWLVFTGGDDNSLSLLVIEISSVNNDFFVNTRSSWNSSSIHCAQITGTKFVDDSHMLSTGIDQRVVAHSYAYVDGLLSVSQIEDAMTLTPDVQGLALRHTNIDEETLACVYGKGLEVIVLKRYTRGT